MTKVIAAVLAAFLLLPAFSVSALASGNDYFDGLVSVAEETETAQTEGGESCEEPQPTAAPAPEPAAQPEIVDVTPRTEEPVSGAITVTDNTGSDDAGESAAPAAEPPAPDPADPAARPFTPPGTGETVDNATDGDGKEFFTITTPDENVF
jgi:hypothetical protein